MDEEKGLWEVCYALTQKKFDEEGNPLIWTVPDVGEPFQETLKQKAKREGRLFSQQERIGK